MTLLERLTRRHTKTITRNGRFVLITDGDPDLLEAFKELGWSDPYEETATVRDAERATLHRPEGRKV